MAERIAVSFPNGGIARLEEINLGASHSLTGSYSGRNVCRWGHHSLIHPVASAATLASSRRAFTLRDAGVSPALQEPATFGIMIAAGVGTIIRVLNVSARDCNCRE